MTPAPFAISDKIVCVNDTFEPDAAELYSELPKLCKLYVVRGMNPPNEDDPSWGVHVVGIDGLVEGGVEWGFYADRFRLLSDVKRQNSFWKERNEK